MQPTIHSEPLSVIELVQAAINRHDLDGMVACFAGDYMSEQPAHPERPFSGREQVRKNWSQLFNNILDFHADLLGHAVAADDVWAEWRWAGAYANGSPFEMRGITIMTVREGQISAARLYMEPVQQAAGNIDSVVKELTTAPGQHA